MDAQECRRRFAGADHAYLATAGLDARPHLVPVVVALDGDRIVFAVDDKPKRTTALRRLRNLRENPRAAFLVDGWSRDWEKLWWVRADAFARVVEGGVEHAAAVQRLRRRHPQYARMPLTGAVVVAEVDRWVGWAATGG